MNRINQFIKCIKSRPSAVAVVKGSRKYPDINGTVSFFKTRSGILVRAELSGLPKGSLPCESPIFAFHIHEGRSCSGNPSDPFANVGTHYNPNACPHPFHAGDMPPLFAVNGLAVSEFLTDRFTLREILGRAVIIHGSPDDFTTQPSGNAGEKIACGIIKKV